MKKKDKHQDEAAAQLKRESAELLSKNPQAYEAFVEMMKDKSLLGVATLASMGEVTGLDDVEEKVKKSFVGDVVIGNPDEAATIPDTFEGEYSELMEDDTEEDFEAFVEVLSQIDGMQFLAQALKALKVKGPIKNIMRPIIATWINCGKAFETMLDHVGDYIDHEEASTAEKKMLEYMVRLVVRTSIETGRRTRDQWEAHADKVRNVSGNKALAHAILEAIRPKVRKPSDSMAPKKAECLEDFITVHSDKIVNEIGNLLIDNPKGENIALMIITLDEMHLIERANIRGLVGSMEKKFPNSCKSARTVQEWYNKLTTTRMEVPGESKKILMLNTDKYRNRIEQIKARFNDAMRKI